MLWGRLDLANVDQMDFSEDEAGRLALRSDDLLVCEGGEVGRTAVWHHEIPNCLYQNHLHRLRAKTPHVHPEFVMYWMQAALLHLGLYGGMANKTTIPNLSGGRLKNLPIPLPKLNEQQAIAGVLTKIQAALQTQHVTIAKLKALKAATMAKLFREGLRGEPLKQTEIGEIPESWLITRLDDLANDPSGFIQTGPFGSQLHASDYVTDGIPIVNPTHLEGDRIQHANIPRISHSDGVRLQRHKLKAGDILFSRRGDVGRHAHVFPSEAGWLCGTGCLTIRPRQGAISSLYLSYYLSTPAAQEFLRSHAVGSIMPNINTKTLASVPVGVPSPEDQARIADVLRELDERIQAAREKQRWLSVLFSSALTFLMTGQLRTIQETQDPAGQETL